MHIQRTSNLLAATGLVLANRALLRAGLRRRVDGWRRATGLLLREEASMFVLSVFGLDVWSDVKGQSARTLAETQAHTAERLLGFLKGEVGCHVIVRRGELEDRAEAADGPSFTLAFQPPLEGPARFVSPNDWNGERVGGQASPADASALMNIVCRVTNDGQVDVWMRVNHAGADGVPMQEILSRLEAAWGAWGGNGGEGSEVRYPSPEAFEPYAVPRPLPGRPDLCEVQGFVDFTPLLKWRKRENTRLAGPMTLSAAMLWSLARHRSFSDLSVGTTVEVGATKELGRGVGVVVVRPTDYFDRKDGLVQYVADFNRLMELTRRRASGACKTLDAAALMPAKYARALLSHALENSPQAFGSLGLTMLKDARVFGAPIAEAGHRNGFVAVGSVALVSDGETKVGCVTIKGPTTIVALYPMMIREAVAACDNQE